jgi:8-oxo-dGTP pyrophosphatase MutT (NUDIX family)
MATAMVDEFKATPAVAPAAATSSSSYARYDDAASIAAHEYERHLAIQMKDDAIRAMRKVNASTDTRKQDLLLIGDAHRSAHVIVHRDGTPPVYDSRRRTTILSPSELEILLVFEKGAWCLPGGKGQGEEASIDMMIRELHEESGKEITKEVLRGLKYDVLPSYHYHRGKDTIYFLDEQKFKLTRGIDTLRSSATIEERKGLAPLTKEAVEGDKGVLPKGMMRWFPWRVIHDPKREVNLSKYCSELLQSCSSIDRYLNDLAYNVEQINYRYY